MARIILYILMFSLISAMAAQAADAPNRVPNMAVDPALCRAVTKHVPEPNVTYQPGIDVHGNPVAPADVAGTPDVQMPQTITIPLTVSLAKVLNLNTAQYPYSQFGDTTEALIGTLTVNGDQVFLNGKPLSDTQQDNLSVLCLKPK